MLAARTRMKSVSKPSWQGARKRPFLPLLTRFTRELKHKPSRKLHVIDEVLQHDQCSFTIYSYYEISYFILLAHFNTIIYNIVVPRRLRKKAAKL